MICTDPFQSIWHFDRATSIFLIDLRAIVVDK